MLNLIFRVFFFIQFYEYFFIVRLHREYDYQDLSAKSWQPKVLAKLIKRLTKLLNLPDDIAPNVAKGKQYGQLQFLLRKNYYEKGLSHEAFREMVREILPLDAEMNLKLELIDTCTYNNDLEEAVHWMQYVCLNYIFFSLHI